MTGSQGPETQRCAIVVPCYNEAARLATDAFRSFIAENPGIHFILVNDGSVDRTAEVLQTIRHGFEPRVDILDLAVNGGKGEAVRRGLLHACSLGFPIAGFWDADLATPLPAIRDLFGILIRHPHIAVVMGSRVKLLGRDIQRDVRRHIVGRVFATVVSNVLRLPVYDTQCGAKLFRNDEPFRAVIAQPFLSRWVFDVEILARMIRLNGGNSAAVGERVYEFPLEKWIDISGSRLRLKDFFRAALDIWLIYRGVLR